ncbi:unnamed protein product [Caenorhabditis bovis]|uniref:Uncharacterized protein n=1 Tax=Caenorhabditis bovis TaxID=2654633 RepID=A0A8S1F6U7_9PELO|nr:unnamed protein product [Caenorhabditis bovis]
MTTKALRQLGFQPWDRWAAKFEDYIAVSYPEAADEQKTRILNARPRHELPRDVPLLRGEVHGRCEPHDIPSSAQELQARAKRKRSAVPGSADRNPQGPTKRLVPTDRSRRINHRMQNTGVCVTIPASTRRVDRSHKETSEWNRFNRAPDQRCSIGHRQSASCVTEKATYNEIARLDNDTDRFDRLCRGSRDQREYRNNYRNDYRDNDRYYYQRDQNDFRGNMRHRRYEEFITDPIQQKSLKTTRDALVAAERELDEATTALEILEKQEKTRKVSTGAHG